MRRRPSNGLIVRYAFASMLVCHRPCTMGSFRVKSRRMCHLLSFQFWCFFFFLVLAALTFFLSSSSAHRQGIHLRKLHLPAARAHEQACPRETFHSLAGWQRDTCVTERFYPYIFLCFSFNSFFSSWKTIANTRHLAVIAVRWTGDYRQKPDKMIGGRVKRSRGEPVHSVY